MTAITETPSLARSWLVWSCAALFFGYQFMLRLAPSVMTEDLMRDLNVDACTLGLLTSAYFYAYAGLQIPVGTALDRIGPRRLLAFAGLVCAAGCLLFSYAHDMHSAALARFLIGAGSAFGFLSCMKVGALWFPPKNCPWLWDLPSLWEPVARLQAVRLCPLLWKLKGGVMR